MQISFQGSFQVSFHLFAIADFLEKNVAILIRFRQLVEYGQCVVEIVFAEVIFSDSRKAFFIRNIRTQNGEVVEIEWHREDIRKIQMARI